MVGRLILSAVLFMAQNAIAEDLDVDFFTRAESYSSSDGAILKSYLNKLIGPAPKRGEYALSRNNIEFGMAWDSWEFSFFHRNDYNLGFHPDTLEFAYKNNNKVPIPLDEEYQVSVKANQYQLTGVKLGHEFRITDDIALWAAGSYIHATEAVSGYLGKSEDGSGGVISKSRILLPFSDDRYRVDLNGNLHTDYFFTDDPLFERYFDPPTGEGYSLDVGASWRVKPNFFLDVKVSDALSKVYWLGLAHTIADATSDRFVEDEEGVWQANASYSGWGVEEDFHQELTRRIQFSARYDLQNYSLSYEYDDMGLTTFHRAKVGYQFSHKWGVEGSLDVQNAVYGLKLLGPYGDMFISFDDFGLEQAHNIGFGWALRFPM